MSFEANQGQEPREVRFASHGNGYGLFLTAQGAVLTLTKAAKCEEEDPLKVVATSPNTAYRAKPSGVPGKCSERRSNGTDILRMGVVGGNPAALPQGAESLPGIANYFIGNDPARWHANVPTYAKVRYPSVYPGVDLLYYGHQGNLEYDFVVAQSASVRQIRIRFDGARQLHLNADGDLQIRTAGGGIAFHRPSVYQLIAGKRKTVEGRFALLANRTAGFVVGWYDHSKPLVIDPQLAYSTYLGGSNSDGATGIAVDTSGSAYIVGTTNSLNFPTTSGSFQPTSPLNEYLSSQPTVFVTKLSSDGETLVYSTYLGGSNYGPAYGQAIAVDSSGSAYVTGYTDSSTFPVTTGAFQTKNRNFGPNAFVARLNSTGSGLVYSTYLGGSGNANNPGSFLYNAGDEGFGIAIDAGGNAYVTGTSYSPDFPVTSDAYQPSNKAFALNENNVFVSKLNSTGTALFYSTYLGGSSYDTPPQNFCCGTGDTGLGITVDTSDNAYVVGFTASSDFPVTTNAFQTTNRTVNGPNGQGYTGFVSKVSTTGAGLNYSTYLGGTNSSGGSENYGSIVRAIAIDGVGEAYLAGNSGSPDFPITSNAYQATNNEIGSGYFTGIVAKLNATGTDLLFATYLGGSGGDSYSKDIAEGIAIDSAGDAYVVGHTYSSNFPVTSGAYQSTNNAGSLGQDNAFITELNPSGSALVYSTYLGGSGSTPGGDAAYAVALDLSGNAYFAGTTLSLDFPISAGAYQSVNKSAYGGTGGTAFVAKLAFGLHSGTPTTTTLTSGANPQTFGLSVAFQAVVAPSKGSGIPTGDVVFSVDGSTAYTGSLDATGTATFSTDTLTQGTHTIIAVYAGDSTYDSSRSSNLTEAIYGFTPVPVFSPSPGTYMQAATVTITDSLPGATIYYTTDGTTPTTSSKVYYGPPMKVTSNETIEAIANGSMYSNSAVATANYAIQPLLGTMTFSPAATEPFGTSQIITISDTLTYSGVQPTGVVAYVFNGVSYTATCTTAGSPETCSVTVPANAIAALPVAAYTVTGSFAGDANYAPATAATGIFTVTGAPASATTIALTSSSNSSIVGQAVTFTATVTNSAATPTGSVTFLDGTTVIGTATLISGGAFSSTATLITSSLAIGTHPITVTYAAASTGAPHADTFAWTNWTQDTPGNATPGSASGTLASALFGTINVTYSGQTSGLATQPSWGPASTFSGGIVGNAPPAHNGLALEGGYPYTETITFSQPVTNPSFAIWSLGSPSISAYFNFTAAEPFNLVGGGPSYEYGGQSIVVAATAIYGNEGNGVVQFIGTYSSLTFTIPDYEDYYALTVGEDQTLTDNRVTSSILNQVVTSVPATDFGTITFSPAATEPYGTNQSITISDTLSYTGPQPTGAVAYVLNGVRYTATCTTAGSPETCTATVPAATIAALPVAAYTVTASFAGDADYAPATASSGTFTITKAQPVFGAMTFSPAATEPFGTSQIVTISDTLSYYGAQPTGAVTYVLNGVSYSANCTATGSPETCTAAVPAATIAALAVLAYSVPGSFAGDNNYAAATAANGTLNISKATPLFGTMTFLPAAIEPYGTSQVVTINDMLTYAGARPTGVVTYVLNGVSYTATCTTGGSPETCSATVPAATTATLPATAYSVGGSFAGDTDYTAVNASSGTFTITRATPLFGTMTFSPLATEPYGTNQAITIGDTLSYSGLPPAGRVRYVLNGASYTATCTVGDSPATCSAIVPASTIASLSVGAYTVTGSVEADSNYVAATAASANFTISAVNPSITFTIPNHIYGDAPFSVGAISTSTGAFTYSVLSGPAQVGGTTVTLTGAGAVTLQASQAAAGNYSASSADATFTVAKATPSIAWPSSTIVYGTALGAAQLDASATSVGGAALPGTFVYTPAAGTVPYPPSQTLSVAFTPVDVTDYNIASATSTVTVSPATLTMTANSATKTYGTINPAFSGTISGQQNGDTFVESFSTSAVTLSPVASYAIIPSATGAHLADYTQNVQNGTLTIRQAGVSATLTASAQSVLFGHSETFTATLTSLTRGTPTGAVKFFDNGTPLGSAVLTGGQVSLTSTSLTLGTHVITVSYNGDNNFTPVAALGISVTVVVAPPDFTFVPTSPTTVTMHYYNTATFTFHVTPLNGNYYQPVTFSYAGELPPFARDSFSPRMIAVNAGAADITFTVDTTRLSMNERPGLTATGIFPCILLMTFLTIGRLSRSVRRLQPPLAVLAVLLIISCSVGVQGCGTGFADEVYPITVQANSGGVTHSAIVTVHILKTPQ